MKYVFDYEEVLSRRITIDAHTFQEAYDQLIDMIEKEEIVLDSSDFLCGKIELPLSENSSFKLKDNLTEKFIDDEDFSIELEWW